MNKPITILNEEFRNNLINLINNSQLPMFIVEYNLKQIFEQVQTAKIQEEQQIKQQYENSLKEEEKSNETKI